MEIQGCQEPAVVIIYVGSRGDIPWSVCYGHALYKLNAPAGERLVFKAHNRKKPLRIVGIDEWIATCVETLLAFQVGTATYQDMWAFNDRDRWSS